MRNTVRVGGAFALWVVVTAAAGCETLGLSPPANQLLPDTKAIRNSSPPAPPVPRELAKELQPAYVVEPGDTLLVQPADLDSPVRLPPDQVVFADGTIDLGVYGRPVVAGRTQEQIVAQVSALVTAKEGEREKLKEPVGVTVRVIGRTSKVYYVLGEVNAPGAFPVNGFDAVLDGIIRAGGVTNRAALQAIVLSRPTPPDGCRVVLPVCYSNIVQLGDTSTNYQLQPGDSIYVPGKGLLDGLFNRCRPGTPCDRPQAGCFGGGCGALAPGLPAPGLLR